MNIDSISDGSYHLIRNTRYCVLSSQMYETAQLNEIARNNMK